MIEIPTTGFNRSVNTHNVNFYALCDWIEGSVLIGDEDISKSDVIDVLLENNIYAEQDFASEIVDDAWAEISRRMSCLGESSPIEFVSQRLEKLCHWQDVPAHSFCLTLSYSKWYPKWAREFGYDFNEQGAIFEELTKEAMQKLFPKWVVYPTGWTKTNVVDLPTVVSEVANHLGEIVGNVSRWASDYANEAGLDLLCYRPFNDGRVGKPVFLMQCASGADWDTKLHTPNINLWRNIVVSASTPKKAFSMPYALSDREFINNCTLVDGLLLDRYRLLSAGADDYEWVSTGLKQRIIEWALNRVAKLPFAVDL